MPRILPTNSASIKEAAAILRAGGVVAFPTETVYGLGACTFNEAAIERVYELKGRPADNPLIAHVRDAAQSREVVAQGAWDERCELLARHFWPGPLTLVLPKSDRVPDRATAGRPTVAVRAPRHATAQALLAADDFLNSYCIIAVHDDYLAASYNAIVDDHIDGLLRLTVEFDDAAGGQLQYVPER